MRQPLSDAKRGLTVKVAADGLLHQVAAPLRGGPDWDPVIQAAMCKVTDYSQVDMPGVRYKFVNFGEETGVGEADSRGGID